MAYDVFISYPSEEKATADLICNMLESRGISCWIAPRDILPGMEYPEAIIRAIRESRIMVLVFSEKANSSPHILREVDQAVANNLTVIPVRIENVLPADSIRYFIGTPQWLDAFPPPLDPHLERLAEVVRKYLPAGPELPPRVEPPLQRVQSPAPLPSPSGDPVPSEAPALSPARRKGAAIVILLVFAAILGIVLVGQMVRPEACSPGWDCHDSTHRGYESSDCSWSSLTVCPNGCLDGECIMPLPGDDILDWKVLSVQNNSAVFQVHESINPAHGCAPYQAWCDYHNYSFLGGTLLKDGSYLNTEWFPGQEFHPEQLQPYIVGWNQVRITVYGDEPITSDEIEFRLLESINKGTDTVYTEKFPFIHTWNP